MNIHNPIQDVTSSFFFHWHYHYRPFQLSARAVKALKKLYPRRYKMVMFLRAHARGRHPKSSRTDGVLIPIGSRERQRGSGSHF